MIKKKKCSHCNKILFNVIYEGKETLCEIECIKTMNDGIIKYYNSHTCEVNDD